MPEYIYRREDGSTFTMKQKFLDDPLTVDPETGQKVVRVIQPTSVIFKGSGFYVNDSKGASKTNLTTKPENGNGNGAGETSTESKSESGTSASSTEATTTSSSEASSSSKSKEPST